MDLSATVKQGASCPQAYGEDAHNTSVELDSGPAREGSELAAFHRLELMQALSPDEVFLPSKAKEGAYSKRVKAESAKPERKAKRGNGLL